MGKLLVRIEVDDKGNAAITKLGKNAKKATKQIAPLGSVLKTVFASAIMLKGLAALNRGMVEGIKNAAKFELATKRLGAIGNLSAKQLGTLSDQAREVAKNTEFSATAVANAQLSIKRMGLTAKETFTALPKVVDLATVAQIEMQKAAEASVGVMRAFGLEAKDMERVTRVMAITVAESGAGFDDFLESMKFVAPIAKATNVSLEETSALIGTLANVSIKGSLGGTSLKNMFLNILKTTPKVEAALKGINFEGKSFAGVLKILKNELGENAVSGFLKQFNKRAVAGALAVGEFADATDELQKKLQDGTRTIADIADEMRDSLIITAQMVVNNFNDIFISLAKAFGKEPQSFLEAVIGELQELNKWVQDNEEGIAKLAKGMGIVSRVLIGNFIPAVQALAVAFIGAKIAKTAVAVHTFVKATQAATKAQLAFNIVAAINPYVLLGTAIAGTVFMGAKLVKQMGEHADRMAEIARLAKLTNQFFTEDKELIKQAQINQIESLLNIFIDFERRFGDKAAGALPGSGLAKEMKNAQELVIALKPIVQLEGDRIDNIRQLQDAKEKLLGVEKESIKTLTTGFKFKRDDDDDKKVNIMGELNKILKQTPEGPAFVHPMLSDSSFALTLSRNKEITDILSEAQIKAAKETGKEIAKIQQETFSFIGEFKNELLVEDAARLAEQVELQKTILNNWVSFSFDMAQQTLDIFSMIGEKRTAEMEKQFEKRANIIEQEHDLEVARAGDSAFQRQLAEERFVQRKVALEKKLEEARKERAGKEKGVAIIQSGINTALAVTSVLAQQFGGVAAKAAAASIVGGLGAIQTGIIAGSNFRLGSGLITGVGNATSDSNVARVSKGERLLSVDELGQIGGNQKLQQIIDQGTVNNSSVTVYIDTIIGDEEYVRSNVIPVIESELSR